MPLDAPKEKISLNDINILNVFSSFILVQFVFGKGCIWVAHIGPRPRLLMSFTYGPSLNIFSDKGC